MNLPPRWLLVSAAVLSLGAVSPVLAHSPFQVAQSTLTSPSSQWRVGDTVEAEWKGHWYKAKVIAVDGVKTQIHYLNYGKQWDEWVTSDRLRKAPSGFSVNEQVEIEWKGSWYPGVILKTDGDRYFIHYDNYDDSWNEWVTLKRLRSPQ